MADKKIKLKCHTCKRVLTKRRAFKLGRFVYCTSDYFQAMKKLEQDDPESFRLELGRVKKGRN